MKKKAPNLYIIAGPNGAGKTTSALKLLPDFLNCNEYVNADGIAAGLSLFRPESVAITAGRFMLSRMQELFSHKKSFAFETTLASRSFVGLLKKCKDTGYTTNLIFLWLQNPELAIQRVSIRAKGGGHSIPEETIRRRFIKGLENFFNLYIMAVDTWTIYDNSSSKPELIARKSISRKIEIINDSTWLRIGRSRYESSSRSTING
jgi:predicted ABC-type ATPase